MFYSKINQITFNNGESLDIQPNDIVIFVGPNNSGKSQSLRDIFSLAGEKTNPIVIKNVSILKGNSDELKTEITNHSKKLNASNPNQIRYIGYNYDIYGWQLQAYNNGEKLMDSIRNYLISYLKTEERLTISDPPKAVDRNDSWSHPIHYLVFEGEYRNKISYYFKEAFGYELTPNYVSRKTVSLCLGETPHMNAGDAPAIMEQLENLFASYPKLHEQGDGMRSFAGVVLHLILKNYGVFLIDEPESFLHPPQARILGKVVGELIGTDRQAFIATHSEDIIKGLMEVCSSRIKVIRISREGNNNHFALLRNEEFHNIWDDSLLRHSNIMKSLFHKNVVLCESDSDCSFYSIILDYLKSLEGSYSETLFIHCGGKQRMKQVVMALRSLSIEFRCVPDIDVLNDKNIIKGLYEACGGTWGAEMETAYTRFSSNLNAGHDSITKQELRTSFEQAISGFDNEELTSAEVKRLSSQLRLENKWAMLKSGGQAVIPAGQATVAFNELNSAFQSVNLFVVPVGELERFVPEEGGHGPAWLNSVLENYKDIGGDVFKAARDFVSSWRL
ncbi:MAG: AAA family ATPase [Prevotella sp.]|nr:AAA family ATPase [Prevotella sp.]